MMRVSHFQERRQTALRLLCGLTAGLIVLAIRMALNVDGDIGVAWAPTGQPFVARFAELQHRLPGERTGLQIGDLLDTRELAQVRANTRRSNGIVIPRRRNDG